MAKENDYYVNREISWLSFNARVLQEAADPDVPLIERIKFIGIFSSNLDEFFRVRVGSLQRMLEAGVKLKSQIGGKPKKIINEIQKTVIPLRKKFDDLFDGILHELEKKNIFFVNEKQLTEEQQQFVHHYFLHEVHPRLVPIMIDSLPDFPYLKNQVIYLAIYLKREREPEEVKYALIEVPADVLSRFLPLPGKDDKDYIIMLDDVIRFGLKEIFSILDFDSCAAYTIKLTRNAEFDIEDDITKSFYEKISESIKRRAKGRAVRFVYDREIPDELLNFILKRIHLENFDNLIPGGLYHNARDFMSFPHVSGPSLIYETREPLLHRDILRQRSLLNAMRKKDILLHYPYQSFDYILDLLREAAIDHNVTSIKMTLYRVAKYSNVVNALINAIRNGKSVTVLMELQARFDEEANIYWIKRLEEEGAKVIEGVPGLKVHAKLCLVTRREDDKKVRYATVGTGNFNETTAKIYSDHTLLTADKRITNEVNKVFDFLEHNYKTFSYKHLMVAPFYMRKNIVRMIKNEIKNAQAGKEAYIYIKLNSLVDRTVIDKLYEAGQSGVKIKMIIRSICSLVPGVKRFSENIAAISIVDKYLEHSRIFIFCNGGEEKYYLSSADWMIRNLDNRVEVAVPIYDKRIQKELKTFMDIQFKDRVKARIIDEKQSNRVKKSTADKPVRAQDDIYEWLKSELEKV
ncbi:MAG TPA: polyphosphate kinase 1 [Bacteroidetes bacterium]|nr:polyphosphate kinase 1 [Bacteroidota bacterium]